MEDCQLFHDSSCFFSPNLAVFEAYTNYVIQESRRSYAHP